MLQLFKQLTNRRDNEDGASAVEYGLLVAAIAALIVIIVFALGGIVQDVFTDTCDEIVSNASTSSAAPAPDRSIDATSRRGWARHVRAHPRRLYPNPL